jgi:hypothetical protein
MLLKSFILSVTMAAALSVITSDALAWGASRSSSASGNYGGSVSHSSSFQEAMVTIHTLVLPPRRDATETPTLAATPAPATMATVGPLITGLPPAEQAITAAIRLEATAPTTMAEAMVAEASMRQRSADRMATSMHREFIAGQFGESEASG